MSYSPTNSPADALVSGQRAMSGAFVAGGQSLSFNVANLPASFS
jgi:hypothetical protein